MEGMCNGTLLQCCLRDRSPDVKLNPFTLQFSSVLDMLRVACSTLVAKMMSKVPTPSATTAASFSTSSNWTSRIGSEYEQIVRS